MKKYILYLIIILIAHTTVAAVNKDWHTVKSTHFIVYYKNASDSFIEKLLDKSEYYYEEIAYNLGFRRYNFWLWDNRARIYIYDDAKEYQDTTGQPAWSSGAANARDKIIHTFPYAKGFFETILPHEMGHIIFREFVGFDNNASPIWLDEGVASYQENFRNPMISRVVKEALYANKLIGLEELSKFNPQSVQDEESVRLFYAEAVSVVDYLVREFSKDNFVRFCRALRDKRNLDAAISSIYPFRNIQELDKAWQVYRKNE